MTLVQTKTIHCSCGNILELPVYESVNTELNPEVAAMVLQGKIHTTICNQCHRKVTVDHPFLYHDTSKNIMVWMYPEGERKNAEELKRKLRGLDQKIVERSREKYGDKVPQERITKMQEGTVEVAFSIEELKKILDARTQTGR